MHDPIRIAVIGAGIAGLSCATSLQAAGHTVTVFEKSRGASGRMSTRKTADWQCDHGARFFTVKDAKFREEVNRWLDAGLVAIWTARQASSDGHGLHPNAVTETRYVGIPRMNAIGQALARALTVRTETTICRIVDGEGGWILQSKEHACAEGPFDAVLLAIPAPQAAALLNTVDQSLHAMAMGVQMRGCWTLMMQYPAPPSLHYEILEVGNSPLAWIARDSSKPARDGAESWVLQATPEWSEAYLEYTAEQVGHALLAAWDAVGGQRPVAWTAHRWRYSDSVNPLQLGACWHMESGLGVCGDWVNGGGVEGAWLSGRILAGQVLAGMRPAIAGSS
jgi:predicted NAD/FAD-dependent oxidoreductase